MGDEERKGEAPVEIHDLQAEALGDEDAGPETPDEDEATVSEEVAAGDEPTAEGEGVTA